jgi:hypothetical protein
MRSGKLTIVKHSFHDFPFRYFLIWNEYGIIDLIVKAVHLHVKKSIIIAIIAAAIVVPAAVYAASPLFINTTIDEPVPEGTQDTMMEKDEGSMMDKSDDAMMEKDGSVMSEGEMTKDDSMTKDEGVMMDKMSDLAGTFAGAGDGIHDASGTARVLHLEDGGAVLRLEDFRVTNGPDLFVYLSADRTASDYVDLGMLKANSGNQNYELPDGVDLSKYDNVIIWCKSFSVYFGGAQLA